MGVQLHATISAAVHAGGTRTPRRPAVILVDDPDERTARQVSFAELDTAADRVASHLVHELGIPSGSRVLLAFPQSTDFAVALVATQRAGLVAVPTPLPFGTAFERSRVAGIVRSSQASAVLTASAVRDRVDDWAAREGLGEVAVVSVDEIASAGHLPGDLPSVSPDDVALLQYTSGSTAEPKGVVVRHRHITANVQSLYRRFGLRTEDVFGGWIPMYHDMGLFVLLSTALLSESTCVLMDAGTFLRRPLSWLRMIERFGINVSAAPNFAYSLCVRRVDEAQRRSLDLSGWRCAINGSEPIDPETLRNFRTAFADSGLEHTALRPGYGLAEATVFVSGSRAGLHTVTVDALALREHRFERTSSAASTREIVNCGPPQDLSAKIMDPDTGQPSTGNNVGEIWLQGDCITDGYWQAPEATASTFVDRADGRWLRTGDLGVLLDGELYVTGRIKDLIIVNGQNFYPHDIEAELRSWHPDLGHVGAVFTVPTDDVEAAVVVGHEVLEPLDEEAATRLISDLRRTLVRQFGLHAAGVLLLPKGGVPRTTSGKIRRHHLSKLFLDGQARPTHLDDSARRLVPTMSATSTGTDA